MMEELVDRSMALLSFTMLLMAIASGLGLVLGVLGLYGVLSKVASQRAPEIAVRIAVGAEASRVRRMVIARGARLTLCGLGVGLVTATAATRLLESLLFGVSALDAATFLAMSAAMLSVALLASYLPALRASKVDPMQLLRSDHGLG
jgi:ABC-type antimicrobial peptide transport system permease subunit